MSLIVIRVCWYFRITLRDKKQDISIVRSYYNLQDLANNKSMLVHTRPNFDVDSNFCRKWRRVIKTKIASVAHYLCVFKSLEPSREIFNWYTSTNHRETNTVNYQGISTLLEIKHAHVVISCKILFLFFNLMLLWLVLGLYW